MSAKKVHKLAFYDVYTLWFSHRLLANPSRYIHINSVRKFSALFNTSVGKCCLHSFYYIFFRFTFTAAKCIPYHGQKENWLYQEQKFPGTFAPGNESSPEHSFPAAKVPGNFRSWERRGAKVPGSEKSWYRCSGGGCYRLVHIVINFADVNCWRECFSWSKSQLDYLGERCWLSAIPVSRQGFDNTANTQNISAAVSINWLYSYAAVHKQKVPVIDNPITKRLMLYHAGRSCVTSALLKTFPSLKPVF